MRKWFFVVGILVCSVLFFLSGTLVGYSTYDRQLKSETNEKEKPLRKVSKHISPVIGNIIASQVRANLVSKIRVPTPTAVAKAEAYKSQF